MKNPQDLILGKAFCIFIFFHFPDSGLSVLLNDLPFFLLWDGVTVETEAKNQAPYTQAVCHMS